MPLYFDPAALPAPMSLVTFKRRDEETGEVRALQSFTLIKTQGHETKEGEPSGILTWRTDCMDCGHGFAFTSGLSSGNFYRRCKKCRRGKQPAGWPKGPRIRHEIEHYIDPASLF